MSLAKRLIKASKNPNTALIDDSKVYNTRDYYDTGNCMLNAAFCGSVFGGVGSGMVYGIVGPEASGKTSIIMNVIKYFLENNEKGVVFFEESEGGNIDDFAKQKLGEEYRKRFITCDVSTIEDVIYETHAVLDEFADSDDEDEKLLIILDSLGGLSTDSEIDNIESNKDKADVGKTQKQIKKLFRTVGQKLKRTGATFLVNGHIYEKIGAWVPTKEIAGGSGFKYHCTNILMLAPKKDVEEEKITTQSGKKKTVKNQKGIKVKATASKSRFVAQDKTKIWFKIGFKGGISRYSGIFEFLEEEDLIRIEKRKCNHYIIDEIGLDFTVQDLKEQGLEGIFGRKEVLEYVDKHFQLMFKLGNKVEEEVENVEEEIIEQFEDNTDKDTNELNSLQKELEEVKLKLKMDITDDEKRKLNNRKQLLYRNIKKLKE